MGVVPFVKRRYLVPLPRARDALSERGSHDLAAIVANYWKQRGKDVTVWVEEVKSRPEKANQQEIWCVRSNLIRGLPQGEAGG